LELLSEMNYKQANIRVFILIFLLVGSGRILSREMPEEAKKVDLKFSMQVHEDVFEMTNFGEPPQIAIWLENPLTGDVRTVWVARRSGRRLWKGKFECPTALPIWQSRHKNEKSKYKARGLLKRLVDAISGATPDGGVFQTTVQVAAGTSWNCYIEVNVSADFNTAFTYRDKNDMPDPQVNGQPSLIYFIKITARSGSQAHLKLIGRSRQLYASDKIIADTSGITTAKDVVTDLKVECLHP